MTCPPCKFVVTMMLFAVQMGATTVPRLDLRDMVHSAELILHGRIAAHSSGWDATHRFIWTQYVLEIKESLKGNRTRTMTIAEPGGSVAGTTIKIAGTPEYQDGEEVVVFLEHTPVGYWRCYGWAQGKYTVTKSASGIARVRTSLQGLDLVDAPGAAGARRPTAKPPIRQVNGMELGEFKRLVLSEVNR